MVQGGPITLCGLAARYNDEAPLVLRHFNALLWKSLALRGFITAECPDLFRSSTPTLIQGIGDGSIRWRETTTDGIAAPLVTYLAMLRGEELGKRLVRLP